MSAPYGLLNEKPTSRAAISAFSSLVQIFKLVFARQPMGRPFLAPPGLPADRVEALRSAFMETLEDREFLAEAFRALVTTGVDVILFTSSSTVDGVVSLLGDDAASVLGGVTLASIGDCVIVTDAEGRITFMNEVAETVTGWKWQEAKSKQVGEVFPDVGVAVFAQALVVKSIDLRDLAGLVISSKDGDTLGVTDLKANKESNRLDGVVTTVDVVTWGRDH